MDRDTLNVLSLCSGVGGLDAGVELATGGAARVVCHVEREAFAAAILAARMEDETMARAPVWSDLRTFDGRPWRGVVDCVVGGYPCPPFSFAGRRGGENDPRHLWPEVARIVADVEPGIVFCENVGGHLSLGFDAVAGELHRMGYRTTAGLFTAEEVGAPHERERLFILAVDSNATGIRYEEQRNNRKEPVDYQADAVWETTNAVDAIRRGDMPVVCREHHGIVNRMDRLRAIGNGCVPLVAAYAFVSLFACLRKE